MKNINLILFSLVAGLCTYCGKPVDITDRYTLDKNNNRIPTLAFEGRISNQVDSNYIKIMRPGDIRTSETIVVDNATVTISDNRGNNELLTYTNNGRYQCLSTVGINDGRIYTMKAVVDGKSYTSNVVMPETPLPVDSMRYAPDEDHEGRFKILIYARVHTAFPEFYLFQNFKDGVLANGPTDIIYASNDNLNGKIGGLTLTDNLKKGVKFRYKFFCISKEAYTFYNGISDQINSDGGVFSTPPANANGNIADAAGLFSACYFTTDTITIR